MREGLEEPECLRAVVGDPEFDDAGLLGVVDEAARLDVPEPVGIRALGLDAVAVRVSTNPAHDVRLRGQLRRELLPGSVTGLLQDVAEAPEPLLAVAVGEVGEHGVHGVVAEDGDELVRVGGHFGAQPLHLGWIDGALRVAADDVGARHGLRVEGALREAVGGREVVVEGVEDEEAHAAQLEGVVAVVVGVVVAQALAGERVAMPVRWRVGDGAAVAGVATGEVHEHVFRLREEVAAVLGRDGVELLVGVDVALDEAIMVSERGIPRQAGGKGRPVGQQGFRQGRALVLDIMPLVGDVR